MKSSGAEPASRLVLDTSAYSWMRSGNPTVIHWVAAAEAVIVPVIVLGELEAGFRLGRRTHENQIALSEFLSEPFISIWPITADVARQYGEIMASLRRRGTPIPVNDIWIAAVTMDSGAHLLTFDHDFERIDSLACTVFDTTDA